MNEPINLELFSPLSLKELVWRALRELQAGTIEDIKMILKDISLSEIKRALARLIEEGRVLAEKDGRKVIYKINLTKRLF